MAKEKAKAKKKLNNPIIKALRFFLSVVSILVLGYVILNYVPFIAKYEHFSIATGSMEPIINIGDVVIIDSSINPEDLEEGQIIAFYEDIFDNGTEEIVVHYLDSITVVDGERVYKTRPAINDRLDPWELNDEDILGIHVATIRNIGSFLMFAQSSMGRIILVVDLVVVYLVVELLSDSKKKKDKEKIESEEI